MGIVIYLILCAFMALLDLCKQWGDLSNGGMYHALSDIVIITACLVYAGVKVVEYGVL